MRPTHRDRVLEALRLSSLPLDDDQLARRTGIRPRHAVNQVCRALEAAGILRRYVGPDGKIVNELVAAGAAESTASDLAAARVGSADPIEEPAVLERAEGHGRREAPRSSAMRSG